MARIMKLTHERLLQVLDYQPATGVFTWLIRASNRIKIGDRAGQVSGNGHRYIMVDGERLQANRLAWFWLHKAWPVGDIKILNGNLDDCSEGNLQEMTRIEGARLRGALSTNTSGVRGVSPAKHGNWKAAITANYRQVNLGIYPTKEEAAAIYEYAMAALAGKKTAEECELALDAIVQHRRKKVAWNRLVRSGRPLVWTDFDTFAVDVGYADEEHTTVAADDESRPAGPGNFKWLLKPQGEFDRTTKEGNAAYMKAYRDANPGRWRHSHLQSTYGISDVDYHRMLDAQGGVCGICQQPETKSRGFDDRKLSIDHDHETGAVRGLLCGNCNEGIGYFGNDRPDLLRKAATYLDAYYGRTGESFVVRPSSQDHAVSAAMAASPHRDWLPVATLGFGA